MERAGRSLAKWKAARGLLTPDDWARAAWPAAVGKQVARNSRVIGLVRDRLVIEVEDALFQRNLNSMRKPILRNLAEMLGEQAPKDLEFRIGVPRRPPQREEAPRQGDEADRIADPYLAQIYRNSRRKAGA